MWLKVRVSSLSLIRLHWGGKLVKFDRGRSYNLSKASRKVCFILFIHVNSNFLLLCWMRTSNGLSLGLWWQSIIWYFSYVFSTYSLHLKTYKMRVGGVVNVLRNILNYFHSSRCNSVLSYIMQLHRCFDCFVARNHVDHQIKTSREWSRMKNWISWVHGRLLKTILSEENSFQVRRSFQMK